MKRLFLMLGIVASLATSSFAADIQSSDIMASFHKSFKYAKNVSLVVIDGNYRVNFNEDGQQLFAYYTPAGDLMGVAKLMSISELPARLQEDLKHRYSDYTVSEVFLLNTDVSSDYYIILNGTAKDLVLQSGGKKWSLFKKTTK